MNARLTYYNGLSGRRININCAVWSRILPAATGVILLALLADTIVYGGQNGHMLWIITIKIN